MQRCSSVVAIPQCDQMVLLVRHAERSKIADIRTHESAMLTEQGKVDSQTFGRVLGRRFPHLTIWHSPVPRCRDTASYIVRGTKETSCTVQVAGPLHWLGGDFIQSDPGWVNHEVENGDDRFFRQWACGHYSKDQITSMNEAAAIELEKVNLQMEKDSSAIIIDVTHDWNILVLRETYLGLHFQEVGLPEYLDSIAILKRRNSLALWSHGKSCIITT